mmetsp:Transcript_19371/g.74391  ORF Transcript_19371/g.74391 Transcript_19371/m.74391 type:complete len:128 (-) Transcript_19371:149-532(-)
MGSFSRQTLCMAMLICMLCLALSWYFTVQMAEDPFPIRRQKRSKSLESLRRKQEISDEERTFLNEKYAGRQHGTQGEGWIEVEEGPASQANVLHPAHPHHSNRVHRQEEEIRQVHSQRQLNPARGVY